MSFTSISRTRHTAYNARPVSQVSRGFRFIPLGLPPQERRRLRRGPRRGSMGGPDRGRCHHPCRPSSVAHTDLGGAPCQSGPPPSSQAAPATRGVTWRAAAPGGCAGPGSARGHWTQRTPRDQRSPAGPSLISRESPSPARRQRSRRLAGPWLGRHAPPARPAPPQSPGHVAGPRRRGKPPADTPLRCLGRCRSSSHPSPRPGTKRRPWAR